jgi:hypothetical protein
MSNDVLQKPNSQISMFHINGLLDRKIKPISEKLDKLISEVSSLTETLGELFEHLTTSKKTK